MPHFNVSCTLGFHSKCILLKSYIFSDQHNLALNKPASQISVLNGDSSSFAASKAVDGNLAGVWPSPWSCSHTQGTSGPEWWMVNLETCYSIAQVTVTARNDAQTYQLGNF